MNFKYFSGFKNIYYCSKNGHIKNNVIGKRKERGKEKIQLLRRGKSKK